jgi:uncharacterized membrane-anchored protein YjiN (DUF445 family)
MKLDHQLLKALIVEELTKTEVKGLVADEVEKQLKSRKVAAIIEDEILKALGKPKAKEEVAEIAKKVLRQLYKDMSVTHKYMIDRIKVS